mmetsp:Transcript_24603/g.72152  ORF Transcript_24603/g.72152 Transcript_24603/m.72152 type:complete len:218 (-) Transcript_24603:1958-2611(-)
MLWSCSRMDSTAAAVSLRLSRVRSLSRSWLNVRCPEEVFTLPRWSLNDGPPRSFTLGVENSAFAPEVKHLRGGERGCSCPSSVSKFNSVGRGFSRRCCPGGEGAAGIVSSWPSAASGGVPAARGPATEPSASIVPGEGGSSCTAPCAGLAASAPPPGAGPGAAHAPSPGFAVSASFLRFRNELEKLSRTSWSSAKTGDGSPTSTSRSSSAFGNCRSH